MIMNDLWCINLDYEVHCFYVIVNYTVMQQKTKQAGADAETGQSVCLDGAPCHCVIE